MKKSAILIGLVITAALSYAQDTKQPAAQGDLSATTESMSHDHHHMGAHMYMSPLPDLQPGDQAKAQTVVDQAPLALERYKDSKLPLADDYKIFLTNLPQHLHHSTH